jgi:hypothetical protein
MGFPYHGGTLLGTLGMKKIIFWFLLPFLFFSLPAFGETVKVAKLPGDAEKYMPILVSEINTYWPDLQPRQFIAALIDQESNWKQNAQLRTEREHGCGWGQFTIAYNKDGTARFDALSETKRLDPSLANWNWEDCTNATYQLRAVVLKVKSAERGCTLIMKGNINVKACNAAKYNGGSGSVDKRVRYCRALQHCDPTVWTGNLELQCPQSNVKVKGYGESFCDINSKYPSRVFARMSKFNNVMVLPKAPEVVKPIFPKGLLGK